MKMRHVVEERFIDTAVFRRVRHVGLEIMDLPVARDRQMQRIDFAVDDHDAELAIEAIGIARIELIDQANIVAGKLRHSGDQLGEIFDANKMPAGVKARRPHQKWK